MTTSALAAASSEWQLAAQRRVLIYDASPGNGFLGAVWALGAHVLSASFDRVIGVRSVEEFFVALTTIDGAEHMQLWGHGAPGAPIIGEEVINPNDQRWTNLKGAEVWFRSCSVLQGASGYWFARTLSLQFNLSVAGHLCVIGTWGMHSQLVGIRSGQAPWWPQHAGVGHGSTPWAPRTVTALRMSLPKWTWSNHG